MTLLIYMNCFINRLTVVTPLLVIETMYYFIMRTAVHYGIWCFFISRINKIYISGVLGYTNVFQLNQISTHYVAMHT